mmetsp:Transcript_4139/g.6100  ORF Transcript_4139/g.6100 Transcript_4139/m.6100 type:complete len:491 (-) Transcript_4139:87-1559(-)
MRLISGQVSRIMAIAVMILLVGTAITMPVYPSLLFVRSFQVQSYPSAGRRLSLVAATAAGKERRYDHSPAVSLSTRRLPLLLMRRNDDDLDVATEHDLGYEYGTKCDESLSSNGKISASISLKDRRKVLTTLASGIISSTTLTATLITSPSAALAKDDAPSPKAPRIKGAAEYDLEFYMRDLVKGNKKEGNLPASSRPTSLTRPSRTLAPFVQSILNDALDDNCIAIRTLSSITGVSSSDISREIQTTREKVSPSFNVNNPWKNESVSDEYYFDVTSYALYRVAANLMPGPDTMDYQKRNDWVELLGREIYDEMKRQNLVQVPSPKNKKSTSLTLTLTDTVPLLQQILSTFANTSLIESYRLGDKNDEYRSGNNILDEYDNDDLEGNVPVNCLISLYNPATLTSSLQIVGEQSRFIPDFIGTTIAAMWREELGQSNANSDRSGGASDDIGRIKADFEAYFVDGEYRPNPKDYFPNELLLQYTILNKKKKK